MDAMNGQHDGMAPPALFSQAGTASQMEACGCYWPEAFFDVDKLMELALQPSKLFGFATVRIPFDITCEAERMGCTLDGGDSMKQPAVTGSPYMTESITSPPELMPVDEYITGGRLAMHLEAAEKLSKQYPDLFLTASMLDPIGVASFMVGFEQFMMATFMEPDKTLEWVDKVSPYQNEYAKALSEVCDNIFILSGGSEEILPAEQFETFIGGNTRKLLSNTRGCFTTLHCCGITDNILESLAGLGATAISVESWKDPEGIYERVKGKARLVGGVDPIGCLMSGTPKDVIDSAKKCSLIGFDVIMPECGVPPQTNNENLLALSKYRES